MKLWLVCVELCDFSYMVYHVVEETKELAIAKGLEIHNGDYESAYANEVSEVCGYKIIVQKVGE